MAVVCRRVGWAKSAPLSSEVQKEIDGIDFASDVLLLCFNLLKLLSPFLSRRDKEPFHQQYVPGSTFPQVLGCSILDFVLRLGSRSRCKRFGRSAGGGLQAIRGH